MWRETEERKRAEEKHWNLAGSKLGNLMGVKPAEDEVILDDKSNYR